MLACHAQLQASRDLLLDAVRIFEPEATCDKTPSLMPQCMIAASGGLRPPLSSSYTPLLCRVAPQRLFRMMATSRVMMLASKLDLQRDRFACHRDPR